VSEPYRKEIVQHLVRSLLEIQLLRIVGAKPTWGYKIKKQVETEFDVKLRHGDLYPALKTLEARGFLASRKQRKKGRSRKVYAITEKGKTYLQTYYDVLRAQVET
jgi:DNA-binding PadR family transcriptional regulator